MSEPGGVSPGEVGGLVAGAVTLLAAIGAGIRWLVGWLDTKTETRAKRNATWEAELDARERAFDAKLADNLKECEAHCAAVKSQLDETQEHGRKMRVVIELVLPELERAAPASVTLALARKLLADIFPHELLTPPAAMPADMPMTLAKIDSLTA